MEEIVLIFERWLIPFICTGICGLVLAMFKKHKKDADRDRIKDEAIQNAVKSLLRTEIIRQYEKYSERGYFPIYAREPLRMAHDAYAALGGNSVASELYNRTVNLPTEPEG